LVIFVTFTRPYYTKKEKHVSKPLKLWVERVGGIVTDDGKPMIETGLPKYLIPIKNKVAAKLENIGLGIEINHVLVNEYLPGQGIMAHTDGPAYVPVIATLTVGGGQTLNIRDQENRNIIHQGMELFSFFTNLGFSVLFDFWSVKN